MKIVAVYVEECSHTAVSLDSPTEGSKVRNVKTTEH